MLLDVTVRVWFCSLADSFIVGPIYTKDGLSDWANFNVGKLSQFD